MEIINSRDACALKALLRRNIERHVGSGEAEFQLCWMI
jgi:hypothetical protein